jgi:type I restriction enzyme R subunit
MGGFSDKEQIKTEIQYMKDTDMAVVVSQEQNEIDKFKKLGLDIAKHRKRMVKEDLATKFKDPDDPFRIVFVCAMWMTGFDVKPLSTIYLDKPLRNHTLMQTIARANRVFRDKTNGLIVDYIGIFRNLQKALAIYADTEKRKGDTPIKPKSELIKELELSIKDTEIFCKKRQIETEKILIADKLLKIKLIMDATDAILTNDDSKKNFLLLAGNVRKLFKAILPDPDANKYYPKYSLFNVIADKIIAESGDVDISQVMSKVENLLDESIGTEGYIISEPLAPYGEHVTDLSKIDFEALRKKFQGERKHIQAEKLRGVINSKLTQMVRLNKTRINFMEKFQQLIDEYNAGAINIEVFFDRLMDFAKQLNEEEKRGISENLTEEELALFDMLSKPNLSNKEKQEVKLASNKLLKVLKEEKFVLDWRKRQQTRADVLFTIEIILDKMLPGNYTPEIYRQKCDVVYQHVYDSYYGAGKSIYTHANA